MSDFDESKAHDLPDDIQDEETNPAETQEAEAMDEEQPVEQAETDDTAGIQSEEAQQRDKRARIWEFLNNLSDGTEESGQLPGDDMGKPPIDYHNQAVACAFKGQYRRAARVCMEGLMIHPSNVDLLADLIRYSANCGASTTAKFHYRKLKSIPFCRWNWRAFTFSIEYLLKSDPITNEEEIRSLVTQYKESLPYEEKAYMAESDLEIALGNPDQAMKVLMDSIQRFNHAPQCALRLAELQFKRGLYAQVIDTCNYGIAASAEPQPSILISNLLLFRVMSKDHLLVEKANHGTVKASEVNKIRDEYQLLLEEFPEDTLTYADGIRARSSVLKFIPCENE